MRQPGSYSLVILVATLGLLATQAIGYPVGASTKSDGSVEGALKDLIIRTNVAKAAAGKLGADQKAKHCKSSYDDAVYNLDRSVGFYKAHDIPSFKIYVSAAIADYSSCDDGYAERGVPSPFHATNEALIDYAGSILGMV